MHSCPALAYERDAVTGAVLIRSELCIGCKYCSWACPYGAPQFEPDSGVMGKCTFCSHRLADGLKPACASLCPTGALDYAEVPAELLIADAASAAQALAAVGVTTTPSLLDGRTDDGPATAWLCTFGVCQEPATSAAQLAAQWDVVRVP